MSVKKILQRKDLEEPEKIISRFGSISNEPLII